MSDIQSRIDAAMKKKRKSPYGREENNSENSSSIDSRIDACFAKHFAASLPQRLNTLQESKNQMYKNYNSRFTDGNGNYKNTYRGDTADALSAFNSSRTAYESDSRKFLEELTSYEKYLDAEQVKKIKDALADNSDLDDIYKAYQGDHDYFSQWENEEAYNYSVPKAEKQKRYSEMSDDELEKEIEKLGGKSDGVLDSIVKGVKKGFKSVALNNLEADIAFSNTPDSIKRDIIGDIEKTKNKTAETDSFLALAQKEKTNRKLTALDSLPDNVKKLIEEYTTLDRVSDTASMSRVLDSVGNALAGGGGAISAPSNENAVRKTEIENEFKNLGVDNWKELVGYNRIRRDEELNAPIEAGIKEAAKEHPFLTSLGTIAMSPAKMFGAGEMIKSVASGSDVPLNYNSPYFTGNNFVNTTRETVMENYDWEGPKTNIDWFDQIYSTAMSTGDSLLNTALTGGSKLGGAVLGATAMSDTAQEVARNGGSKEQALLTGIIAGLNEMIWENKSIGNFKALKEKGIKNLVSKKGVKTLAGNILKSVGVNASEEFNTEAANIIVDYLVNGGLSSYAQAYDAYRQGGYTETEARKKARNDMINQTVMSGVGGAMQGLLMGGAGSALGGALTKSQYNQQAKNMTPEEISALQMKAEDLKVDVTKYQDENGNIRDKKRSNLISVVEDAEDKAVRRGIIEKANTYGIKSSFFANKSDIAYNRLAKKVEDTEKEIVQKGVELSDSIWEKAYYDRLVELGENKNYAQHAAKVLLKQFKGEAVPGVSSKAVNQLYNEISSQNAEWFINATQREVTAIDNLYKKYAVNKTNIVPQNKTASESNASMQNVNTSSVVSKAAESFAAQMETPQKQEAALQLFNSDIEDIGDTKTTFDFYYNAGLKGEGTFEQVDSYKREYMSKLPEYWRKDVFDAGRENKSYAPGAHKLFEKQHYMNAEEDVQIQILDAIGKKYGVSFLLYDELEKGSINGVYFSGTNKIAVSMDSEISGKTHLYLRTAGHECFHLIEEWNPKAAQELKNKVVSCLKKDKNYNYTERLGEYADLCDFDIQTELDLIHSEMAADSMFDVFSNERFLTELVSENRTLAQKIKDFISDFIIQMKKVMNKFYDKSPEIETLNNQISALEEIRSSFHNALRVASIEMQKNLQNEQKNSASRTNITEKAENDVTRKSKKAELSKSFTEEEIQNIREKVVNEYGLKGINNYIDTQKNVLNKLLSNGFFTRQNSDGSLERPVIIKATNAEVVINQSGIKETFGNGNKFQNAPAHLKVLKLATVSQLPQIIENAKVVTDKVGDKHKKSTNKTFTYLEGTATIDGKNVSVRITLKNSRQKSKFWLHYIDVEYKTKKIDDNSVVAVANPQLNNLTSTDNNLPQNDNDVNSNSMQRNSSDSQRSVKITRNHREQLESNPLLRRLFEVVLAENEGLESENKRIRTLYMPGVEQIRRIARRIKEENPTGYDVREIEKNLMGIFDSIQEMTDVQDYTAVINKAFELSQKILGESKLLDSANEVKKELYDEFKDYFAGEKFPSGRSKGTYYFVSEGQQLEIENYFGNYNEFSSYMRKFNIHFTTSTEYQNNILSRDWDSICENFSDYFQNDTKDLMQPIMLYEAFKTTEYKYGLTDNTEYNQQLEFIAADIFKAVSDVSVKADTKLKKEAENYYRKIREIRLEIEWNYKERLRRSADSHKKTVMINRIRHELVRLANMAANGNKKKHIPVYLLSMAQELLQVVTFEKGSGTEEFNTKLQKFLDNAEILTQGENDVNNKPTKKDEVFAEALDAFRKQLIVKNGKGEVIGFKRDLTDLNGDDLEALDKLIRLFISNINRANEVFINGKKYDAENVASKITYELSSKEHPFKRENALSGMKDKIEFDSWKNLIPVYAFKIMGSDTFCSLMDELEQGELEWGQMINEAKQKADEIGKKYNKSSWDNKRITVKLSSGEYALTWGELMHLYIANQREQYKKHLFSDKGGFVFADEFIRVYKDGKFINKPRVWKKRDATPHQLTPDDMKIISAFLTEEQRAYANEMRNYLSINLAEKANATTRELYDINYFTEQTYFPIKTSDMYVDTKSTNEPSFYGVLTSSVMKGLQEDASNPIVLCEFDDLWAEHVDEMAKFNAFSKRMDTVTRVLNYRTSSSGATCVKMKIKDSLGKGALSYIENFIRDVGVGVKNHDGAPGGAFMALYKKAAVFGSASVVFQQPSAIARALVEIHPKYFKPGKLNSEEMKRYAPVAFIKAMGNFDPVASASTKNYLLESEKQGLKEKSKAFVTEKEYRDYVFSWLPGKADEITWAHLWNAVKNEVADKQQLEGEALLEAAGKRFNEVVRLTQVYDSVFAKSEYMRSKDGMAKHVTSFMAEPTLALNMLLYGSIQMKNGNIVDGTKYWGAFFVSIVFNNLLKAIVTAPRDEDEDETLFENYLADVINGMLSDINPLTYIPFIRDVWSIFNGYSVERADVSLFQDLYDSLTDLFSEDEELTNFEKLWNLLAVASNFGGIPLRNITRDVKGLINTAMGVFMVKQKDENGEVELDEDGNPKRIKQVWKGTSLSGVGNIIKDDLSNNFITKYIYPQIFGTPEEQLYNAIRSNDYSAYEKLQKGEYGGDASKVRNAIKSGLVENDERVTLAAQARLDGDFYSYDKYVRDIAKDGFSNENVVKAVNSVYNELTKIEESSEPEEKFYSLYSSEDLNNALETGGDYETVINDMIEASMKNGSTRQSAESAVKTRIAGYWKEVYFNASAQERKDIEELLDATGLYRDIEETTSGWIYSILKEEYLAATSTAERNRIKQEIWKSGCFSTRRKMNDSLEKLLEGEEEE